MNFIGGGWIFRHNGPNGEVHFVIFKTNNYSKVKERNIYNTINGLKLSTPIKPINKAISYINLSDKVINEDEHRLLGLGPKHTFKHKVEKKSVVTNWERISQLAHLKRGTKVGTYFIITSKLT